MAEKRWISRDLVKAMIENAALSRKIGDEIAKAQEMPAGVAFLDLQHVLEAARDEIKQHREWHEQTFKTLPQKDDESGLTGPLRQAFSKSATARNALLEEVMTAYDKYLKAQAGAFDLRQ